MELASDAERVPIESLGIHKLPHILHKSSKLPERNASLVQAWYAVGIQFPTLLSCDIIGRPVRGCLQDGFLHQRVQGFEFLLMDCHEASLVLVFMPAIWAPTPSHTN